MTTQAPDQWAVQTAPIDDTCPHPDRAIRSMLLRATPRPTVPLGLVLANLAVAFVFLWGAVDIIRRVTGW